MSKNRYLTLIVITALFFSFVSCSKDKQQVTASLIENSTLIKFEKDLIDFGKLSSGEVVTCSFKFKNTGKNDLIISSVTGNCGCTVADYPRTPIAPNQEGQITVRYDSEGTNQFRVVKEISVLANTTPATTKLRIVADIN
jgi:hypothetical protein